MRKNIEEIRRNNLKELIKQKFSSISEFARQFGTNKANISTLLSGSRSFTDFTANKIESTFALPQGFLSSEEQHDFVLTDFVNVKYFEDVKYLVGSSYEKDIKIANELIKQLKLNNHDHLLVTYMNDDKMYPTIKANEMIFVDKEQTQIEDNKIYLLEVNGFYVVRRLVLTEKTIIEIHIDNIAQKDNYVVKSFPISDVTIIGKVVGLITNLG